MLAVRSNKAFKSINYKSAYTQPKGWLSLDLSDCIGVAGVNAGGVLLEGSGMG